MFYPCLKSCALHPESSGGTRGSADDLVPTLGKGESGSGVPEEYLKLVDEDPTWVMPNEVKNSSPSFRAIVTLFKRISDEYMIARPAITALMPSVLRPLSARSCSGD